MDKWIMCVVALMLGMLMFHMLKGVCGCKVVEGANSSPPECQYSSNCKLNPHKMTLKHAYDCCTDYGGLYQFDGMEQGFVCNPNPKLGHNKLVPPLPPGDNTD